MPTYTFADGLADDDADVSVEATVDADTPAEGVEKARALLRELADSPDLGAMIEEE